MLKVFEAFSGVGAQHMALRNLKEKYKIVATSDIDSQEILSYYYVHGNGKKHDGRITTIKKREYLNKIGIESEKKINSLDEKSLNQLYDAVTVCNNLGDITKIDTSEIPDHDLFTYSFPCQDISSVGTRKGLDIGSGTRSSLLWECQRIIEQKKPKYLLLENVKNFTTGKNKKNFEKWLEYLESQGYDNYWKIFDAKDYGIPQRRPRVIVVSKYGKSKTNLVKTNDVINVSINKIIDNEQNDWKPFKAKAEIKGTVKKGKIAFLDDRDWKINGVMISDVCSTQRAGRTGLKLIKNDDGLLFERKLNSLECCRLMGFSDEFKIVVSDTSAYQQAGNSIVVDVLIHIMGSIIKAYPEIVENK